MPYSLPIFDDKVKAAIKAVAPKTALDVGVGSGKIGTLIKEVCPSCVLSGCEVCEDYFVKFADVYKKYQTIYKSSIHAVVSKLDISFDLVVFGDVLEHLLYSQVHDVLEYFQYRCRYMIVVMPVGVYQGATDGQISERHVSDLRLADMCRYDIVEYARRNRQGTLKCFYLIKGYQK